MKNTHIAAMKVNLPARTVLEAFNAFRAAVLAVFAVLELQPI